MKCSNVFLSAATTLIAAAASNAQFFGDYAPGTWTITAPSGGTAVFGPFGLVLTITGPDGLGAGAVDVTHAVVSGGTWSFHWDWTLLNTSTGFDNSYYLLNGVPTFLSDQFTASGDVVRVPVATGDIDADVLAVRPGDRRRKAPSGERIGLSSRY